MADKLPQRVADDLSVILPALREIGYEPVAWMYSPESFGDWFVDFAGPCSHRFRITLDRSQYIVDADNEELTKVGLLQAFDNRDEFSAALFAWLRSRGLRL
jgi:hypothetical protein